MTQVGAGKYTYELIQDFPKLSAALLSGETGCVYAAKGMS